MTLGDLINERVKELKNYVIDTRDYDFLDKFNFNVISLINYDFLDIIKVCLMVFKEEKYEVVNEEVNSIKDILNLLCEKGPNVVLGFGDVLLAVKDNYVDELKDQTVNSYLSLNGVDSELKVLQYALKKFKEDFSIASLNTMLKLFGDNDYYSAIGFALNLMTVKDNLKTTEKEADELYVPEFLGQRTSKKISGQYVDFINSKFLNHVNSIYKDVLESLINYKSKKQKEISAMQRNINKKIKSLQLLKDDLEKNKLSLGNLQEYNLDDDILNLVLIELIRQENKKFSINCKELERYDLNYVNKLEVLFDEFGRNFNQLTEEEQSLLVNGYSYDMIAENLNFINSSSLNFISELDEVFVNILIQEIDVLMQLDSLIVRKKITPNFVLVYGNKINNLTIKKLVHNVNKLDAQKINFDALMNYNDKILLNLDNDLFDLIVKYGINLKGENIKYFEFLENPNLISVIDKYIEIGFSNQIQMLPNLINSYSDVIIKRILLMDELDQEVLNEHNTLNQMVRNGKDFYLSDDEIDEYIYVNYDVHINEEVLNILNTNESLTILDEIPEEIAFIENYKKNEYIYLINGLYFSRLKVLRCLNALIEAGFTNYKELLFQCLIYNYPKHLDVETIEELKKLEDCGVRKQLI